MKRLFAVTLNGYGKDYVLPAFANMARACYQPLGDVIIYGDRELWAKENGFFYRHVPAPLAYAEDMLTLTREQAFQDARENHYDQIVLCGVDALFEEKVDAELFFSLSCEYDMLAPLITARDRSGYTILREFIKEGELYGLKQQEIPEERLSVQYSASGIIQCGFGGADNLAISRRVFEQIDFTADHTPWYQRHAAGEINVCVEEYFIQRALNAGYRSWCDTQTRVWHVHEDGIARMWKGIDKPLSELNWSTDE